MENPSNAEPNPSRRNAFLFVHTTEGKSGQSVHSELPVRLSGRSPHGEWSFRSGRPPDESGRFRIRSKIDETLGRFSNPQHSWLDVRIDPASASVSVRTDFSGTQPAYFWQDGGTLAVSNSILEILRVMRAVGREPQLEKNAAYVSLVCNFTPPAGNLVQGIRNFENGAETTFSFEGETLGIRVVRREDYVFGSERGYPAVSADYAGAFEDVMREFGEFAKGEGRAGLMFTGGLDSSILLAWFAKNGYRDNIVPITSIIGPFTKIDDEYAAEIAADLGFEHVVARMDERDFLRLPETVLAAEDTTDAYGYGLTMASVFEAAGGVSHFFNGAGTDSAVWASPPILSALWYALYDPDSREKSYVRSRWFDASSDFRGIPVVHALREPVSDVAARISKISSDTVDFMNFTRLPISDFYGGTWHDPKKCAPYSDRFGLKDGSVSLYDLFVLLDFDGLAHRFGDLYKKYSQFRGVGMHSPFAHAALRKLTLECPVEGKLNPRAYPTNVRDNQMFYKKNLWKYVPEKIRDRKKTSGSIPNPRFWLTSDLGYETGRTLLEKFRRRGALPEQYVERLLGVWAAAYEKRRRKLSASPDVERKISLTLWTAWRILVLEIYLQAFMEGKALSEKSERFRMETYL